MEPLEHFWANFQVMVLTWRNIIIVLSSWSLVFMVGKMIPNSWRRGYKAHAVPALLCAVCLAGVWVPGLRTGFQHIEGGEIEGIDGTEVGWRIALGILLALAAYILPIGIAWAAERWLPENVAKQIKKVL